MVYETYNRPQGDVYLYLEFYMTHVVSASHIDEFSLSLRIVGPPAFDKSGWDPGLQHAFSSYAGAL